METAGTLDLDAEFKLWASGLGLLEFEFVRGTNVGRIANILSEHVR